MAESSTRRWWALIAIAASVLVGSPDGTELLKRVPS